jgi:hypothetical protein
MNKSPAFGTRFFYEDKYIEVVDQDENHDPFFSDVINGITQKNKYKLIDGEVILQQLMAEIVEV